MFPPRFSTAGAFFAVLIFSISVKADPIPIIDAHSQIDHKSDLENVVPVLDEAGVSLVMLATRAKRDWREIIDLAAGNPARIIPSVRTKGGYYIRNETKYYRKLEEQLADDGFGAMAELLIWHAAKGKNGSKAPLIDVSHFSSRVQEALKGALAEGWPFILHIEFADAKLNKKYDHIMAELAKLLRAHPDHPFGLTHMGQLTADAAKTLINAHPNIYFLTSHANTIVTNNSRQPWVDMFEGGDRLAPDWQKLVIAHPDRFIMAFDNVWADHWGDFFVRQVRLWRKALAALPHDVAHTIAHRNAERLWKLPPAKHVRPKN